MTLTGSRSPVMNRPKIPGQVNRTPQKSAIGCTEKSTRRCSAKYAEPSHACPASPSTRLTRVWIQFSFWNTKPSQFAWCLRHGAYTFYGRKGDKRRREIEPLFFYLPSKLIKIKTPQACRIYFRNWISADVGVQISSAPQPNRILRDKPPHHRAHVARPVVVQPRAVVLSSGVLEGVGGDRVGARLAVGLVGVSPRASWQMRR